MASIFKLTRSRSSILSLLPLSALRTTQYVRRHRIQNVGAVRSIPGSSGTPFSLMTSARRIDPDLAPGAQFRSREESRFIRIETRRFAMNQFQGAPPPLLRACVLTRACMHARVLALITSTGNAISTRANIFATGCLCNKFEIPCCFIN